MEQVRCKKCGNELLMDHFELRPYPFEIYRGKTVYFCDYGCHESWRRECFGKNAVGMVKITDVSQLRFESERSFYRDFKDKGVIFKLNKGISDFMFIMDKRSILVECTVFTKAFMGIMQLILGEEKLRIYKMPVEDKWLYIIPGAKKGSQLAFLQKSCDFMKIKLINV